MKCLYKHSTPADHMRSAGHNIKWDHSEIQGWIGYTGTHIPMFVHKLGLIKPRQT